MRKWGILGLLTIVVMSFCLVGYSNKESFMNKYGTPTTICAHSGCTNYIAYSGNTNCCTIHSNRCLECKKYTDEDALYCIDCIKAAASAKSLFTNKYGTPTTLCAHTGCSNYIASSGNTNCCTAHSNKCLECKKYTDEDAMYCIDCIKKAASTKASFTNKYGTPTTKCAHVGCSNYIASSGNTNCCTLHSNRCIECNKYTDEDALICIDCLKKAAGTSY